MLRLGYSKHFVKIELKLNEFSNDTVVHEIDQFNNETTDEDLDLKVRVYRIYSPLLSLVKVTFSSLLTKFSLRVLVVKNFRPTYKMMLENSLLITEESETYLCDYRTSKVQGFYYMGILPGPEVPKDTKVTYAFNVTSITCNRFDDVWTTEGCEVDPNTRGRHVFCDCYKFSLFAAKSYFTPAEIRAFSDISLFLTINDNPQIMACVLIVLLSYVILSIWAYRKDKSDSNYVTVTVLEDNFPEDKYPYIVVVYTGFRFGAGTSSAVGLRIVGHESISRSHVLSSRNHKILQRDGNDWFLLLSPFHLGYLHSLHIWHNNEGKFPGWFCEKIYVYDVSKKVETMFIFRQWLSISDRTYPEAVAMSSTAEDLRDLRLKFLYQFALCVRERHEILSIVLHHPRSLVTRLERISVVVCIIMVSLVCVLLFYKTGDNLVYEDDPGYSIGSKEIILSLQSLMITSPVTFLLGFLFRRSRKVSFKANTNSGLLYIRRKSSNQNVYVPRNSSTSPHGPTSGPSSADPPSPLSFGYLVHLPEDGFPKLPVNLGSKHKSSLSEALSKTRKYVGETVLTPARLDLKKPVITMSKFVYITAWTVCILIIAISFYLILRFGLKLGVVKGKELLTSSVLTDIEKIFVTSPVYILIASTVLAFSYATIYSDVFRITEKDIQIGRGVLREVKFEDLLKIRECSAYFPLSREIRKQIIMYKSRWQDKWKLILQFVAPVSLFVSSMLILNKDWPSYIYNANQQLKHLATDSHCHSCFSFNTTTTMDDLKRYFRTSFPTNFYCNIWYNGQRVFQDPSEGYWTSDVAWRPLGDPVVRQVRYKVELCSKRRFYQMKNNDCLQRWGRRDREDQQPYGAQWTSASWYHVRHKLSPWIYRYPTMRSSEINYRLYGPSGTAYDNGGYFANTGPGREKTESAIEILDKRSWLDFRTRAVFVEATLYNVNRQMISQVTLIAEFMLASLKMTTGTIHITTLADSKLLSWQYLLFMTCICSHIAWILYLINSEGFAKVFVDLNNIILLVNVFLGLQVVILKYFNHYKTILSDYINDEHEHLRFYTDNFFSDQSRIVLPFSILVGGTIFQTVLLVSIVFKITKLTSAKYVLFAYLSFATCNIFWWLWTRMSLYFDFKYLNLFNSQLHRMHLQTTQMETGDLKPTGVAKFLLVKTISALFLTVILFNLKAAATKIKSTLLPKIS